MRQARTPVIPFEVITTVGQQESSGVVAAAKFGRWRIRCGQSGRWLPVGCTCQIIKGGSKCRGLIAGGLVCKDAFIRSLIEQAGGVEAHDGCFGQGCDGQQG